MAEDIQDTSDYKLDKRGRKIKAHRIVFNKGQDDGKKGFNGVNEHMKKSFNQFVEQHTPELTEEQLNELVAELQEVLGKGDAAGKWISDFVHSDNPKFAGKSKEKRKQMALAAYYAKQRNEEVQIDEAGQAGDSLGHLTPAERAKELARRRAKIAGNTTPANTRFVNKALKKEETELEEASEINEDFAELLEAYDADDYEASHEKSQFGGHRAVVKHKATGREIYVGGTAYKKPEHAKGEAETYRTHYNASGKSHPGANYRHDRAVSDYRKKAKEAGHLHEAWADMLAHVKKTGEAHKTSTATKHDVKKTSTGTVYTKQRDADGHSKEFNRSGEAAQKRGRGRPKKNSFGEAVEFLMGLDEETFDSFMEEGFDAFMEHYEQLDEVSKATLGSYVKKAVSGMNGVAVQAHMAGNADTRTAIGKQHLEKARKRIAGIEKATDRLTK